MFQNYGGLIHSPGYRYAIQSRQQASFALEVHADLEALGQEELRVLLARPVTAAF
jgi:hypothetical protein